MIAMHAISTAAKRIQWGLHDPPPITNAVVTIAATPFVRTPARGLSTRETKIIAIGISSSSANASRRPGVRCTPACPLHSSCSAPGSMKVRMSAKTMLNITTVHRGDAAAPVLWRAP